MSREREDAGNVVAGLALGGLLALILGGVLVVLGQPEDGSGDGNGLISLLGVVALVVGQLAVLAAIVAWAVRLGIRWSGLSEEIEQAGRQRGPGSDSSAPGSTPARPSYLDEDGR